MADVDAGEADVEMADAGVADVERVKALLRPKLSEQQLRKFRDEDYSRLASAGYCDLDSFETATREGLREALLRPALIDAIRKAFSPVQCAEIALNIDVVSVLLNEFGSKLRDARAVKWESNPLRESRHIVLEDGYLVSDKDPGVYFSVRARNSTLSSLIRASAQAYLNCTRENNWITSRDTGRRQAHFNAVIAYPGAGKTTIGTDYARLLRRFWSENGESELRSLMSGNEVTKFSKMIEDSWNYSCFLYHNIADWDDGRLAEIERGLSHDPYNKILALRFLFAAISKPVPDLSYKDFLELLPKDILDHVTFDNVLIFIRKGLNILHDRHILVSLFLDEINCAEIVERTGESWIQEIVSTYVYCVAGSAKKTKVVPVITVSCTRHEAASLRLTVSRKTPHVPIPVFTLPQEDCLDIVKDFFQRLSVSLGGDCSFELNHHLRLCIKMAGGMPRFLGFMLRGMVTRHPDHKLSGKELLDAARTFDHQRMVETLRNSIGLNTWTIGRYRTGAGFTVLIAAMRHALLGKTVFRSLPVTDTDDISSMEENNWGRLEQKALISLQVTDTSPVEGPEFCPCKVVFPPLLALALQEARVDIFSGLFPSAIERGFRSRELHDLKYLAFMMLLFRHGTSRPQQSFGLQDIIPCSWDYHRDLVDVRLPCPGDMRLLQAEDATPLTGRGLRAKRMELGSDFGLLCQGNGGADSVFVFLDHVIVLRSRSPDAAKAPPSAGPRKVFWSCFSDLTGIAKLSQVDTSEFGPAPGDLRKDVLEVLDNMEAANNQSMEVETASSTGKLRYRSLAGLDAEVEYSEEDNYPLDRIIYVYFSEEHLSEDCRVKIRTSENPLLKRTVLRNQNERHLGFYDLCEIRDQVPLASLKL